MNYFLDEELIAVGVIDIVETALSSVYFFYDPKYKKYDLGVIGALYEIKYIQ
jgi:arginine-tRNA-protein transferase